MAEGEDRSQEHSQRSIEVAYSSDVSEAARSARALASALGFDESASEEIALVASELASNIVKHAGQGTLTLTPLAQPAGIEIESTDSGPGIADGDRVFADGYSTAGSLGYGLGAVNRLMDELEIGPPRGPAHGLLVVAKRWLRTETLAAKSCPLDFGFATRPYPGLAVNGDAFVIKLWGENALVGIIDGLGHGQAAHEAAEAARQYVEAHFDRPLADVFRGTGRASSPTRGVVMALARFDCARSKLWFASVGNVEARVFFSPEPISLMVRRGVLGTGTPKPIVTEHYWEPTNLMVLHSDGLRTHWRWQDFPDLGKMPADAIARELLVKLARNEDDATVAVVRDKLN